MIELRADDDDDPEFLALVRRALYGVALRSQSDELHLVHVDNWFDHKWLEFSGKFLGALGLWKEGERLTVPAFSPNRVRRQRYFVREAQGSSFREGPPPIELHPRISSDANHQRRVSAVSNHALLVWYSGNTKLNQRGAVMVYEPVGESYAVWYVSFVGGPTWRVEKTKETSQEALEELLAEASGSAAREAGSRGAPPRA